MYYKKNLVPIVEHSMLFYYRKIISFRVVTSPHIGSDNPTTLLNIFLITASHRVDSASRNCPQNLTMSQSFVHSSL